MKSAIVFLLLLVSILPTKAAPAKDKKLIRVPFRRVASKRPKLPRFYANANTTSEAVQTSSVNMPLASLDDIAWLGTISIGTPPQSFNAIIDTGSGDTWVPDQTCGECQQLTLYHGDASTTFHDAQKSFEMQYGNGDIIDGTWTLDDVTLGAGLTISQQAFGRANIVTDDFIALKFSGLIALGFSSFGSGTYPTLIESLLNNRLLDDNVFSCRFIKGSEESGGEILFGGIETKYVKGDIQYTNTVTPNNQPTWIIPVADMQIGGRSLGQAANAYVDTGSTLICVSDAAALSLYNGIPGAVQDPDGLWLVQSPFPSDVAFVIGTRAFTIPAADMVTSVPEGNLFIAAIQSCAVEGLWIIGDTFIKNHYLVFDYGKNSIGIGDRNDYQ